MKPQILIVGSSNTDMVTKSDRLPKPGETVVAHQFYIAQGGKGANQAVAAARLGANVTFLGCVGDDDFGRNAVRSYQLEGIDTEFFTYDPNLPTGTALIHIDDSAENMIVTNMGANRSLGIAEINKGVDLLIKVAVVLTQLEMPLDSVMHLAKLAKANHVPLILNPAPPRVIADELIALTDYLIPNQSEARTLTGIEVVDIVSAKKAAKDLYEKGAQHVIITMGASGAYLHDQQHSELIEAPSVKAVDTVGAGDTFCGAFAVAIAEGKPIEEAVLFANQCASLAVTREGAQQGIPYRHEIN